MLQLRPIIIIIDKLSFPAQPRWIEHYMRSTLRDSIGNPPSQECMHKPVRSQSRVLLAHPEKARRLMIGASTCKWPVLHVHVPWNRHATQRLARGRRVFLLGRPASSIFSRNRNASELCDKSSHAGPYEHGFFA